MVWYSSSYHLFYMLHVQKPPKVSYILYTFASLPFPSLPFISFPFISFPFLSIFILFNASIPHVTPCDMNKIEYYMTRIYDRNLISSVFSSSPVSTVAVVSFRTGLDLCIICLPVRFFGAIIERSMARRLRSSC